LALSALQKKTNCGSWASTNLNPWTSDRQHCRSYRLNAERLSTREQAGSLPTTTGSLNAILTNLQSLLTGAGIKRSAMLSKVESVVNTAVGEIEVIIQSDTSIRILPDLGTARGSTMKTVSSLLFLMAVSVWAQSSVVFTWTHNPLNAGTWPACSRFVTTMCQTGYTLSDVTTASAPVVISSTIAESALTYTLTPLPSAGAHIYDLVINGRGRSGNAVQSAPATVTVTVPVKTVSPPTGFAATALSPSVVFAGVDDRNPTLPASNTKVTALCLTCLHP